MQYVSKFLLLALASIGIFHVGPVSAETLTQAQIADQIVDKDLIGTRNGMTVRLRYNQNGSVAMKAAFITGAGTWTYASDEICVTMTTGPKRGKTCTAFEDLGDGNYRNSEGLMLRVQK